MNVYYVLGMVLDPRNILKKGEDDKHIKTCYMNNINSENKKYEKNKIAYWTRKR